jgi:prepilin-type N-terminal cleavage/methylation domain-containing protein
MYSRIVGGEARSAFTLIELLVVLAIISILAVVVVLTLNPAELLRQGRDSTRVSDMNTLTHALSLYQTDQAGSQGYFMGNASSVYVSLPDPTISGNTTSSCAYWNLPALPAGMGYTYQCSSPQAYKNTNGSGWLPVNLQSVSSGNPLGSLPSDPTNTSSTGLYYTYATNGGQYEVTSLFESQKYKTQYGQNPVDPGYPEVNAQGSSLAISPLFNPSGLVGWWPLDEGTGSSSIDQSGNSNIGIWTGTATGANNTYYSAGKVGTYAGTFDGSTDYVSTGGNNLPIGNSPRTIAMWVNFSSIPGGSWTGLYSYGTSGETVSWFLYGWTSDAAVLGHTFTGVPIALNQWTFIAYTYDGSTTITFYWGNQSKTATITAPNTVGDAHNFIGEIPGYEGSPSGLIDDVRVYNRALSAAEVQALYDAEK